MSSPQKKHKKKTSVQPTGGADARVTSPCITEGFDYSKLIPEDLDPKTREIMEKFFHNEELAADEKNGAMDLFLEAVKKEHAKMEEQKQKDEPKVEETRPNANQQILEQISYPTAEVRTRINVGWMASPVECTDETDEKIAQFCQRLGTHLYNFISFPLGGMKRSSWKPKRDSDGTFTPPPMWLPDVQLQNHLWETYINGSVSAWIDCDSEDADLAAISAEELVKELNYAVYLGIRSIIINLRRMDNPRLAEVVNKWLWTRNSYATIWVIVPTSVERFEHSVEDKDCWEVWADFRAQCSNYGPHRLNVGLELCDILDDEFIDGRRSSRWLAEPLGVFIVDIGAYVFDEQLKMPSPSEPHKALLRLLWTTDSLRILVKGCQQKETPEAEKQQYGTTLRLVVMNAARQQSEVSTALSQHNVNYYDILQVPLQPLADNLDSGVYNTFEQDRTKYDAYESAIRACLVDLADTRDKPESLVLYVLGAGRGPLMTAAIRAESHFNEKYRGRHNRLKMQLYVVEKNSNALQTLNFVNKTRWKNRVTVIEGDMRKLHENEEFLACPKPDIIVSELLGSFGDNELSPECLDGITFFLKPTTVSIPQSYTSYCAPIMSCKLHQNIRSSTRGFWNKGLPGVGREALVREKDGSYLNIYTGRVEESNLDQLYVVYLRHYCLLSTAKPVFTFVHPNFEGSSNEREGRITFDGMDYPAELMGFAGYFDLHLYKDVMISIEPSSHTYNMSSWFSAVIPLRKMERIYPGDKVTLDMKRRVDPCGVWYQWFVKIEDGKGEIRRTVLQNEDGVHNYLRFFDSPTAPEKE